MKLSRRNGLDATIRLLAEGAQRVVDGSATAAVMRAFGSTRRSAAAQSAAART
jgi:hypothetical protein